MKNPEDILFKLGIIFILIGMILLLLSTPTLIGAVTGVAQNFEIKIPFLGMNVVGISPNQIMSLTIAMCFIISGIIMLVISVNIKNKSGLIGKFIKKLS